MKIDDRLRRAIEDRTSSVHVDEAAGLQRVTSKLHARGVDTGLRSRRTRWLLAAAAFVLAAAVTGGVLLRERDGSGTQVDISDRPNVTDPPPATDTTTTTVDEAPSTTVPPDTAPAQPAEPSDAPEDATPEPLEQPVVWPRPSSDVRFDDPVAAARSFGLYYAQFDDPVVGQFRQGDARSGEVPVRPRANAPETTVLVRQLQGGHWFVIASVTGNITVDQPSTGDTIGCPVATSGAAFAFEGTVQVRIDAYQPDGDRVEVGRSFVTGSGSPPPGPFSKEIACTPPSGVEAIGIARFWTEDQSGEVDGPWEIVTIPIRLP